MIRDHLMAYSSSCIIEFFYSMPQDNISDILVLSRKFSISRRRIVVKYNQQLCRDPQYLFPPIC